MNLLELNNIQREHFNSNATKAVDARINALVKLKSILQANEPRLYDAIYADFSKSEFETYLTELGILYSELNSLIKNSRRWSKRKRVRTGLANFPARSYIIPEPLGVTLVIGAWNYPFLLSLQPAVNAIAAGNTVILKPSEISSETSKIMAELINNNFPKELFQVVEGGVDVATELLGLKFDKIFFTGSPRVGKIVYEAAAKNLTPVTLELGGKSPTFVLSDANIDVSAKRIVWAKFLNAGQTCVAPDYILVDKKIEQKLLEAMKKEIEANYDLKGGIPSNYLQIVNSNNLERLQQVLDHDKCYYGGEIDSEQRLIKPTILSDIDFSHAIMLDEIFGPILPVLSFESLDEAIEQVKQRPKPLSCYIYGKDRKLINKILSELSFGGGCVNDSIMQLANERLPFGGVGGSGMGSYHGKAGFDTFSHFKSILDKPFWFEPKIKYAPHSKNKLKLIKWLLR